MASRNIASLRHRRSRAPSLTALALFLAVPLTLGCSTSRPAAVGGETEAQSGSVLPLQKVRLYASGVGYFERGGVLEGGRATLPVPAGHLDDALKSLVVLDAGPGLGSVSFPSRLSPAVARARAGLPASPESPLSYDRLLVALRGESVELTLAKSPATAERTLRGRVVDVVSVLPDHPSYDHGAPHRTLPKDAAPAPEHERLSVLVLAEGGEILRFDATEIRAVRALDPIIAQRLHAALSARLATRSNQHQRLLLTSAKGGVGPVRLAYLAEAPTWRASYRLRLPGADARDGAARLQAWALVHNDTDEAWRGIRLELVDGRPSSFLFPITAPRYERRELETPDQELSSVPQLSTTTPDAMWGDFSDYDGESIARVGSEGVTGYGTGGGFGSGSGRLGGSRRARVPKIRMGADHDASELLWVGNLAARAGVSEAPETASSVFSIETPLDVLPQHSAMVPFLDAGLTASPIVWFSGLNDPAERAVGVSNTTSHTLPAGPLAVYDAAGFLGEAMLTTLKPGARQFAQIGDEPDTELHADAKPAETVPLHVDFRGGRLRTHGVRTTTTRIEFNNQSGRERRAYVALRIVLNATVAGCEDVDYETTTSRPFAVFLVPPGKGKERLLVTREGLREGTLLAELTDAALQEILEADTIPAKERAIVSRARPLLAAHAIVQRSRDEVRVETESTNDDLGRLRTHLGSLGKGEAGAAHAPLVQKILEREEALTRLHTRARELDRDVERRLSDLAAVLGELEQFREGLMAERGEAVQAG